MTFHTGSAENATPTIEVISSTTKTVLGGTPVPNTTFAHQIHQLFNTVTAEQIIYAIGLPILLYFLICRFRTAGRPSKSQDNDALDWDRPWLTLDFEALYGLFRLAHDSEWRNTPFVRSKNVQQIWNDPHRPWLRRLLSMGIMPLYIQDGGLDLHYVNFSRFEWKKQFPYFTLPRYQQAKQRAYIEFVVPYRSIDARTEEFIQTIIDSGMEDELYRSNNFTVMVRCSPPTRGGRLFYSEENPPLAEDRPLIIGAQSQIKWLLPFLPDEVLRAGCPDEIVQEGIKDVGPSLALYVKGPNASKVTLLEGTKSMLVRVEAKHYGICELDAYLYGVAQDVGLTEQWSEDDCQFAAEEELEICGLPIGGPQRPETESTWSVWSLLNG